MKDQKVNFINYLNKGFLSFFGTGYFPKAPGTIGSLATVPLLYALGYYQVSLLWCAILTLVIFVLSCVIADKVQNETGVFDPGWIVIDEVVGMLITWFFVFGAYDWKSLLLVFVVFRVFDIIKIWPASYFDKKMKNGFATIFDDVISAIYAGIVVWGVNYFHLIN